MGMVPLYQLVVNQIHRMRHFLSGVMGTLLVSVVMGFGGLTGRSQGKPQPILTKQYYFDCNGLRVPMKSGWDAGATKHGVWLRKSKRPEIRLELSRSRIDHRTNAKPWIRIRGSVISVSDSHSKTANFSGYVQDSRGQFYVYGISPRSDLSSIREDVTFVVSKTVSGDYK